jgi:hypothetical protein
LSSDEAAAVKNVIKKLEAAGIGLGNPHSSKVHDADKLRELRPRAGNSPWRAFYRRIGDTFVVGAIGPEADNDPKGFKRAIKLAASRLNALEED